MINGASYNSKDGHYHCDVCGADISVDDSLIMLDSDLSRTTIYDCVKCGNSIVRIDIPTDPWEDK